MALTRDLASNNFLLFSLLSSHGLCTMVLWWPQIWSHALFTLFLGHFSFYDFGVDQNSKIAVCFICKTALVVEHINYLVPACSILNTV